jgi:hypothetical protein
MVLTAKLCLPIHEWNEISLAPLFSCPNWGRWEMQKGQMIDKHAVLGVRMETHNSLIASFIFLLSALLLFSKALLLLLTFFKTLLLKSSFL